MSQNLDLTQFYTRKQVQSLVRSSVSTVNSTLSTAVNTAQQTADAAQATATTAASDASTALQQLDSIASDNVLSAGEKSKVIMDVANLQNEQSGIDAQATAYSITTEKTAYDNAVAALNTYLATLTTPTAWNDVSGDTTIVGTTFRSTFTAVYGARQTLLDQIYATAQSSTQVSPSCRRQASLARAPAQPTQKAQTAQAARTTSDQPSQTVHVRPFRTPGRYSQKSPPRLFRRRPVLLRLSGMPHRGNMCSPLES